MCIAARGTCTHGLRHSWRYWGAGRSGSGRRATCVGCVPRRTREPVAGCHGRATGRMSVKLTRAVRLELPGHDQLQHLIAGTAWDNSAVWTVPAHEADRLVDGPDAFW